MTGDASDNNEFDRKVLVDKDDRFEDGDSFCAELLPMVVLRGDVRVELGPELKLVDGIGGGGCGYRLVDAGVLSGRYPGGTFLRVNL